MTNPIRTLEDKLTSIIQEETGKNVKLEFDEEVKQKYD